MITVKVQTVKAAAEKYFANHLEKGEYVTEGKDHSEAATSPENLTKYYTDQPVTWHGKTATMLNSLFPRPPGST